MNKLAPLCALAVLTLISQTGCRFLPHALQPNQLQKLNRTEPLGRDAYYFSIPSGSEQSPASARREQSTQIEHMVANGRDPFLMTTAPAQSQ